LFISGFNIINLFSGELNLPEEYFFISAFGNSEDGFKFRTSKNTIDDKKSPSLKLKTSSGDYNFCLRAKIISDSNSSLIELIPTSCNLTYGTICKQKIYEPPKCSGSQPSKDPYQFIMDPILVNTKEKIVADKEHVFLDMFKRLDYTAAFESTFKMLWYSTLPCFDVYGVTSEEPFEKGIIKACYWKGKPVSCAAIFSPIPTDRGMCCAFNMESLDAIFNGKTYVDLASEMQASDKKSAFMDSDLPEWFIKDKSSQPGSQYSFINFFLIPEPCA
jgi:hypothetical protein